MENYQAVFKRKELKYLLTEAQLAALRPVLLSHTVPDAFAHSSILNLYYDTPDFRMIRRSREKPAYKEKLRLRSYGVPQNQTPVFPEIKKKAEGIVYKRRVSMPCRDAVLYLSRQGPGGDGQIFRELDWMLSSYGSLAPRIFLSYERDSRKGAEDPSLRLTLDRRMLWRADALDLRQGAWGSPLLAPGQVLLEVKITNAAPLWLPGPFRKTASSPPLFPNAAGRSRPYAKKKPTKRR